MKPTAALSDRSGCVIAAFPATGKTFIAGRDHRFRDSDSSTFSRGPEWPTNYIEHIERERVRGSWVLVSTHAEVRAALADAGIPFTLVYPTWPCREEYRQRMIERGSPDQLIEKVIDELWTDAIHDCVQQEGCEHIVLRPGQYLIDVLPGIAAEASPLGKELGQ